jgi:hypothetical protein
MVSMERIHRELGQEVCRRCIAKRYNVSLLPEDCWYDTYPHPCSICGEVHNIVIDLKRSGRRKLFFR